MPKKWYNDINKWFTEFLTLNPQWPGFPISAWTEVENDFRDVENPAADTQI